jgi:hypothetical protein
MWKPREDQFFGWIMRMSLLVLVFGLFRGFYLHFTSLFVEVEWVDESQ